jgi:hypothetical protein
VTIKEEILAIARLTEGFRACEMKNHSTRAIWEACKELEQAGLLTKVELSYKHVRHFADPAHAAVARGKTAPRVSTGVSIKWKPRGPEWGPDAPCIITPDTKFTYGASPGKQWHTNTHGDL